MDLPQKPNMPWLWNQTMFLTKHGSHAYGLNTPQSDLDLRGFAYAPKRYYMGYRDTFEQAEFKGDPDIVVYDVRKFFKLAAQCNPNIIETLFTEPADHIITSGDSAMVIENRDRFLSKRAYHTFGGFAVQQLTKIHNKQQSEGQYNYKDAMHLVRLMRQCKEILTEGKITVKRKDREELLAIRAGVLSYEEIVHMAVSMDVELKVLHLKCQLPPEPNHEILEEILMELFS